MLVEGEHLWVGKVRGEATNTQTSHQSILVWYHHYIHTTALLTHPSLELWREENNHLEIVSLKNTEDMLHQKKKH